MAAARKRILRKDIRQPDQFMVWTGWFLDFFKAYQRELIAAGLAVVVVAAAAAGWYYYRGYQRQIAFQQYNQGLREYKEGRFETALDTFRSLKDRGEEPYDTLANLYIANSHIALDQPQQAIEALGGSLAGGQDGLLSQVGLVTLGLAQEMSGSCEEAVVSLERALAQEGPLRQEAMLGKARCNTSLGKTADAVKGYKAYVEEFPEAETAEIALQIQRLEAKTGQSSEQATQ